MTVVGWFPVQQYAKETKEVKSQVAEEEPEVELITKVEVIFEDTKATTRVEPEYKWGEVYRMISSQSVPDTGFEDMHIYANIERSALIKWLPGLSCFHVWKW